MLRAPNPARPGPRQVVRAAAQRAIRRERWRRHGGARHGWRARRGVVARHGAGGCAEPVAERRSEGGGGQRGPPAAKAAMDLRIWIISLFFAATMRIVPLLVSQRQPLSRPTMSEPLGYFAYEKMWAALEAGLRAGRDPNDPKEFRDQGHGGGKCPPLFWAAIMGCPPALLRLRGQFTVIFR